MATGVWYMTYTHKMYMTNLGEMLSYFEEFLFSCHSKQLLSVACVVVYVWIGTNIAMN